VFAFTALPLEGVAAFESDYKGIVGSTPFRGTLTGGCGWASEAHECHRFVTGDTHTDVGLHASAHLTVVTSAKASVTALGVQVVYGTASEGDYAYADYS
jgi:hypothetical protein